MYVFCLVRLDWSACDAFLKIDVLSITHKLGKNKETTSKNSLNPLLFRRFRSFFTLHVLLMFLSEHIPPTPYTEPVVNPDLQKSYHSFFLITIVPAKSYKFPNKTQKLLYNLSRYSIIMLCFSTVRLLQIPPGFISTLTI